MPCKLMLGLFLFVSAPWCGAGPFQIRNRSTDLNLSDPTQNAIYLAFDSAANAAENEINSTVLSPSARSELAQNMSEASGSTLSGIITDRVSEPTEFSVGLGAQFNAYAANDTFSFSGNNQIPPVGVGGQTTFSFGLRSRFLGLKNFFGLDPNRLFLHLNLMRFSVSIAQIGYTVFNVGLGARYLALPGSGGWFLKWGGLSFGTGILYSNSDVVVRMHLTNTQVTPVGGETATTTSDLDCAIGAQTRSVFLPFEVSTSATLFQALSLYLAAAVDVNLGSSETVGSASGPIQSTYSGNVAGVSNYFSGEAALDMSGGPNATLPLLLPRVTLGTQLRLSLLSLGIEASWLGRGTYSAATHMKLIF